ncbi:hypothetical protein KY289_025691 [Solanum tuberosum]|nr:hypothetical protein KY289_025691 [Solanum tuberosum]
MWSVLKSRSFSSSPATQQWKLGLSMLNRSLSFSSSATNDGADEGIRSGELLKLEEVETILRDVKADNVKVFPIPKHCDFADFMVVATGRSAWHVRNISQALIYKAAYRSSIPRHLREGGTEPLDEVCSPEAGVGVMFSEKEKTNKAEGHGITLFCDSAALLVSFKESSHCSIWVSKTDEGGLTVIFSFKNHYNSHLKYELAINQERGGIFVKVKQKQKGSKRMLLPSVEGQEAGNWIVIDSGKVVIHALDEKVRAYYNLEKLWSTYASNQDHGVGQGQMSGDSGISVFPEEDNIFCWKGTITGSKDTVFEGTEYKLSLSFPADFPFKPPKVKFETQPNISSPLNTQAAALWCNQEEYRKMVEKLYKPSV